MVMAHIVMARVVMALYSYGLMSMAYIVMALYSCGQRIYGVEQVGRCPLEAPDL